MNDTEQKPHGGPSGPAKPESPNTIKNLDELDAVLEAGLKSGKSPRTIEEINKNEISRLTNG